MRKIPIIIRVISEPFGLFTCLWAFALVARFYRSAENFFVVFA
jgi:hypothetical protein